MTRWRAGALLSLVLAGAACGPAGPGDPTAGADPSASFHETTEALAAEAEAAGVTTVRGRGDWLFFAPELRHVSLGAFWGARAAQVSRARRADAADPLPAILDYAASLAAAGVDLLVVPVPPKSVVYADELSSSPDLASPPPRLDPHHQAFYAQLREAGIDVLDLTAPLLAARDHSEGPVYCRHDTHWSGVGCVLAGRAIAAEVRSRPWFAELPRAEREAVWRDATIVGDLMHGLDPRPPAERLRLREIRFPGGARRPSIPRAPSCCSATATTWSSMPAGTCTRPAPACPNSSRSSSARRSIWWRCGARRPPPRG